MYVGGHNYQKLLLSMFNNNNGFELDQIYTHQSLHPWTFLENVLFTCWILDIESWFNSQFVLDIEYEAQNQFLICWWKLKVTWTKHTTLCDYSIFNIIWISEMKRWEFKINIQCILKAIMTKNCYYQLATQWVRPKHTHTLQAFHFFQNWLLGNSTSNLVGCWIWSTKWTTNLLLKLKLAWTKCTVL